MISVIVPVYNMELYLPRCLDSIINNTYRDLQIICVNDGSNDQSLIILKQYKDVDPRIMIVNQDNQGVSAARNKGLCLANGDYISFIDADDWVHFQFFEIMLNAIVQCNADVAFCETCKTEDKTEQKSLICSRSKTHSISYENLSKNASLKNQVTTALYKKESINNNNRFPIGVSLAEDAIFNCSVLKTFGQYAVVNLELYYYFQRANSAVHNQSTLNRLSAPKYLIDSFYSNEFQDKKPYIAEQIAKWLLDIRLSGIHDFEDAAKNSNSVNETWNSFFDKKIASHMGVKKMIVYYILFRFSKLSKYAFAIKRNLKKSSL